MLDRFLDALTGRRLGGVLFVLGGLLVAGLVLWPRDEDPEKPRIQLVRIVSVPQLGYTFAHPRAWERRVDGRVIRVRSPDRAVVMTFSSPVAGSHERRVRLETKVALRRLYAPAKIVRDARGRLGRSRASTFELTGRGGGVPVRALVFVGATSYRTYVVTLLTPARPSAKRLREAQQILGTVRLTKPSAAPRRSKR